MMELSPLTGRNDLTFPQVLDNLEREMLQLDQLECRIIHEFRRGVYHRTAMFPAGSLVLGHAWKRPHWNIQHAGGHVRVIVGGTVQEIVGARAFIAPPGRKCFHAVKDTIWTNIIATDLTDIAAIEAELAEKLPR